MRRNARAGECEREIEIARAKLELSTKQTADLRQENTVLRQSVKARRALVDAQIHAGLFVPTPGVDMPLRTMPQAPSARCSMNVYELDALVKEWEECLQVDNEDARMRLKASRMEADLMHEKVCYYASPS